MLPMVRFPSIAPTPQKSKFWGQNVSILPPRRFAVHCRPPCPTYPQHGPSWLPLGAQHRARTAPKGTPKPLPGATFCYPVRSLIFDNPPMVFLYFSSPAGSQRAVCWHKKTFLRPLFFQSTVLSNFERALGSHCANLVPTWRPRWPPTCRKRAPKERFLEAFFASRYPLGAKMPSRGSREPLRPPKTYIFRPFSIDFAA